MFLRKLATAALLIGIALSNSACSVLLTKAMGVHPESPAMAQAQLPPAK